MLIRLDVFAEMLNIRPGELQHAASTDGELDGLALPAHRRIRGAMMMFDQTEAAAFAQLWHTRSPGLYQVRSPPLVAPETPPVTLREFAMLCGLPPLALFQAIKRG